MAPEHEQFDDQILTRYLLGNSPQEEAERLDELSVADEEFAWRLSALENDLVDAYARGELSGKEREQFEARYRSSARIREKVDFARGLAVAVERTGTADAVPTVKLFSGTKESFRLSSLFIWAPAAGALAMLLVAGYLFVSNQRLQQEINAMQGEHRHALDVDRQLAQAKAAIAEAQKKMSQPSARQPERAYVILPPPMRGAGRLTKVTVKPETDFVVLFLMLEADDSSLYRATLKDTSSKQVIWSSAELRAQTLAGKKMVPVSLPSALLKAQNYVVELAGGSSGHSDVVGIYAFRAVLE